MSGCIPAVVSRVEWSSARGISGAEGRKTCPLDSKKARYPARSSADVCILGLYEGGSVGRVLGFRLVGVEGCLACDLAEGRIDLPGGRILETDLWIVEHCVGPLGIGTLVVKPKRHVVHLWELREDESDALGPILVR